MVDALIKRVREKVERRMFECSKLIQPEKSFVEDTTDLALLCDMLSESMKALDEIEIGGKGSYAGIACASTARQAKERIERMIK